jgi:site-specific DNA-cytosine methylase
MMPVRVVSAFSGAGFADYALHRASEQTGIPVEVVFAFDSWDRAVDVYNANLPSRAVVADAKQLTRADLPPHDLVIGGPPCQSHSTAGPKDCHCHIGGPASPRCCLADFQRLAAGSAYLMENVRSRLINAPWSEQLCALDFGDVTTRKRWWYSDHLLHVTRTPGPRRLRDIRDHDADRHAVARAGEDRAVINDGDALGSLTQSSFHGSKNNGNGEPTKGSMVAVGMRSSGNATDGRTRTIVPDDGALGSVTSHSYHQPVQVGMRSYPQAFTEVGEDGVLGSVTSHTHDQPLRVGMRSHSSTVTEYADSDALPSVSGTSYRGHATTGVRCPSLLEMARAHSIPDDWDWAGATKTQRGLLIANGWPIGMGSAVLAAMLRAVVASREVTA